MTQEVRVHSFGYYDNQNLDREQKAMGALTACGLVGVVIGLTMMNEPNTWADGGAVTTIASGVTVWAGTFALGARKHLLRSESLALTDQTPEIPQEQVGELQ